MAERVVYWACEEGLCTNEEYLRRTTCKTCGMKLCSRCYQDHKKQHAETREAASRIQTLPRS